MKEAPVWSQSRRQAVITRLINTDCVLSRPPQTATLVNSREMTFTEHGDYARIFRITYVEAERVLPRAAILSTRLFLPYNKTDTIHDIKQRLSDWVNPCLGTVGLHSSY